MNSAKLGVLALLASAAALYGFTSDTTASNASAHSSGASATAAAKIDNFMLVDADMEAHELYRLADAKAVVIVTQANGDAVVRSLAPALKSLKAAYGAKGVEFVMLNSSLKDSREAILAEAAKAGFDTPILMDANQLVGESLGVTRSAEVLVVSPKTWTVAWRGAMPGAAKALDALTAGQPVAVAAGAPSKGALIAFPERAATKVSYSKDIAPILEAKCVACHEEGGIGPFAMTNYAMVKGFSPMIREVIRTDRMPPYHADPHVGKFSDDQRLSAEQVKTLVHWIEAGSPRGDGPDPLGAVHRVAPVWPLGKPDLVLNVPAYTIPASGVVDYQRPAIANPTTEGKWIRASTVKPGSRQGVHHLLTGWMAEMPANGRSSETKWQGGVGGYAVGSESSIEPPNTGTYLPPGGAIGFQAHYTPFGKEEVDRSQIALYFYDKPPELIMHSVVVMDPTIEIPAGEGRHKEMAYVQFPHDALLYAAFPHAHYRAYSSDLWIQYPDGKQKLLLSLPRYDFNWQRDYTFAEPVKVPAGSKLIAHYVYDNSKRNPSNPDASIKVSWGEQSFQEMLFTSVKYRWVDETATHRLNFDADFAKTRLLGMMDDNLDGKLQKAELKGQIGAQLLKYFDVLDKNHDGALDVDELAAAQGMVGGRRSASIDKSAPAPAPTAGGK